MWENHLYGSEGGAVNDRPYPYPRNQTLEWRGRGGHLGIIFQMDHPVCALKGCFAASS